MPWDLNLKNFLRKFFVESTIKGNPEWLAHNFLRTLGPSILASPYQEGIDTG